MRNVTGSGVQRAELGNKKGWNFTIQFNNNNWSSIVSGLYKTKKEAIADLNFYLVTGKIHVYFGSAE